MKKRTPKTVPHRALALHKKMKGKVEVKPKGRLTKESLSLLYTPGVGAVSTYLHAHPEKVREYTLKGNSVAVVSDGSAVLGLGNIGPYGALPVMEGKALIFKQLSGIDAWPIVLTTQDPEEVIETILRIAPSFGGINLEDIKAPECFEIERRLTETLSIPVMHDDQHGTAIVVLAGLINALTVTKRRFENTTVVINGIGAAGVATARLLKRYAPKVSIIALDTKGALSLTRRDLNETKQALLTDGIVVSREGALQEVLVDADVFIGVSKGNVLGKEDVRLMQKDPIIFALANPTPEILPSIAKEGGARVIATGRSDFPNQINNALVFPGMFRGALDHSVQKITDDMKIAVARALASLVVSPTPRRIIPDLFDARVVKTVALAVGRAKVKRKK